MFQNGWKASLNWIKTEPAESKKPSTSSSFSRELSPYTAASPSCSQHLENSARALPNAFVIVSLFITSITSFVCVKRKAWLCITPPEPKQLSVFVSNFFCYCFKFFAGVASGACVGGYVVGELWQFYDAYGGIVNVHIGMLVG